MTSRTRCRSTACAASVVSADLLPNRPNGNPNDPNGSAYRAIFSRKPNTRDPSRKRRMTQCPRFASS
jgi:hypothetical protein